jgi:NADP-dependent 3-hydroxy acid dehydrogenase YdfG
VGQTFDKWGKIDILINNAGIRIVGPTQEANIETWVTMLDANLKGQFLCTREVLKQGMGERNEGIIIFISSDSGKYGKRNSSIYFASKWGVIGYAESMADELKKLEFA